MMRRLSLLLMLLPAVLHAQVGIGQWRSHLAYGQVLQLCAAPTAEGTLLYAAAPQGLFTYDDAGGLLERLDKTSSLHDVGIATLAYDASTRCCVVAYSNANIDIISLADGRTHNISDLKRSTMSGDKSIHSIRFHDRRAYLACAFGIVVIDLERHEIEDTYYIGDEGAHESVLDIAFTPTRIVAVMPNAIKHASLEERFLNISSHWQTLSDERLVGCDLMEPYGEGLIAAVARPEGCWLTLLTASLEVGDTHRVEPYRRMRVCGDQVLLCRDDEVELWGGQRIGPLHWLSQMDANDAYLEGNTLWVAHQWAGLVAIDLSTLSLRTVAPSGPPSDNVYSLTPWRDRMLLCQGGKSTTYANAFLAPQMGILEAERWSTTDMNGYDGLYDVLSVAVNPKDKKRMLAASCGNGIVEYEDDKVVALHDHTNTPALQPYTDGSYTSLRTGAVCFSPKGDAWMTNSLSDNGLVVWRRDGTWQAFYTRDMVGTTEVDKILYDTVNDLVWFAGRANRLYVADAEGHLAWVNPNQGSKLETSSVTCMAQDHDGTLWIGTNKGLKIISSAYRAFANGGQGELAPINCSNITISNNEFAEYLMAYESITCIAVDGANRKWVGTSQGGLYLISANGQEELLHFTPSNSPLYSNKIVCLGVQPYTGEVFIGTPAGTQSYRATATYAGSHAQDEIAVFPNPVEPGYEGPIAVRGFSRNAIVHISDAAGHVVFSGKADGGQVVWNGRTLQGQRAASGVYFVFASDDQGKNRAVGKILLVR